MESEILPEQKAQLITWAGQRDSILSEISVLQVTKEELEKSNLELRASSTEIESRCNQVAGRIAELNVREAELPTKISKEVAQLQSQKTCLEAEIANLQKVIDTLVPREKGLQTSISFLMETFNSINDRVGLLDKVVGHVTAISDKNSSTVENLMKSVKDSLQNVVDSHKVLVKESNDVANELPKVFLEVQRKSLVRQVINPKKI
jgi:chromosome segregation ATPase